MFKNRFGNTYRQLLFKSFIAFVYLRVSNNQNNSNEEPEPIDAANKSTGLPHTDEATSLETAPTNLQIPSATNSQTEAASMEVHHHGHVHADKKWKEYLFQFLMLFLAVTAGFFVENQREHYVEHKRAKEFARLLVDDLITDTTELNRAQRAWKNIVTASDSVAALMQPTNTKVPGGQLYYYEYWSGWRWSVISRDATLQQLKSSGSLRYFGDVSLIKKILNYEEAIKLTYLLQSRYDSEKTANWLLVQKVFNQSFFDTLETIKGAARDSATILSEPGPELQTFLNKDIPLNAYDNTILFELRNWAENTSRNYRILLNDLPHTKQKAIETIEALKKEYHFD